MEKQCPKCGKLHEKPGTFCSRSCANARGPRTEEFKEAVRKKLLGRKQTPRYGENNSNWKGGIATKRDRECLECGKLFKPVTAKFCSYVCWMTNTKNIKNEWQKYQQDCVFKFNVYEYPLVFDLSLIEKYGWYSASNRGNNLEGISRDHMFSVKEGFRNGVSSELIAHPANCVLMKHSENNLKKTKCSITIEELKERIEKFSV